MVTFGWRKSVLDCVGFGRVAGVSICRSLETESGTDLWKVSFPRGQVALPFVLALKVV